MTPHAPPRPVGLRPAAPDDEEFLYRVYASTRYEELAPLNWPPAQVEGFLRMQFRAQHTYYHEQYPDASYDVILCGDEPAGRLYVLRRSDELHIVDIALLPAFRRGGIGTFLLAQLLAEADTAGVPVRIHVETANPARRLYHRLGFVAIGGNGIYDLMERPPNRPTHPTPAAARS
jgi:ribosomal protein S18 acetylase RimI-like enzyme